MQILKKNNINIYKILHIIMLIIIILGTALTILLSLSIHLYVFVPGWGVWFVPKVAG